MKYGSLNLLDPSRPRGPVMGILKTKIKTVTDKELIFAIVTKIKHDYHSVVLLLYALFPPFNKL